VPDFREPRFLLDHVRHTMAFYHPRTIDPQGGFHHFFRNDGSVYDAHTRHLVSNTRFVLTTPWPIADSANRPICRQYGTVSRSCGSAICSLAPWLLDGPQPTDATNHCYGVAFVLLAYAHAVMAGASEADPGSARPSS
jgi:mannose/cellobiose epimerase-like protein (N-acyl-D-glucosamine 2-epimerase family)